MLFDAKCDTDNAGELLETPTKLGCRILTENKGNPVSRARSSPVPGVVASGE